MRIPHLDRLTREFSNDHSARLEVPRIVEYAHKAEVQLVALRCRKMHEALVDQRPEPLALWRRRLQTRQISQWIGGFGRFRTRLDAGLDRRRDRRIAEHLQQQEYERIDGGRAAEPPRAHCCDADDRDTPTETGHVPPREKSRWLRCCCFENIAPQRAVSSA